jgi:hypothetical protein
MSDEAQAPEPVKAGAPVGADPEQYMEAWVCDMHDNPLMDSYELDGTMVGQAKPSELHEYLRRALLQGPTKIVFEVGKRVRIMRPMTTRELLNANPHIVEAVKLQAGEQASQITESELAIPTDEEAAAQLTKEEGISPEQALAEIKSMKDKFKEKGTNEG